MSRMAAAKRTRCKKGTRKNKLGQCDISECQKELNKLKVLVQQMFPMIDRAQTKVAGLGR